MSRGLEDEVGSFLIRWSRRKAAARRGRPEPEEAPGREEAAQREAPRAAEDTSSARRSPAPAAAEARAGEVAEFDLADLPDPDTLDLSSDFSVFMRPGVPVELQRRALRRLWKIDPIISTPSGIDDYYIVNDFSDASTVVADLKTLYRVGRGMVAASESAEEETARERESSLVAAETGSPGSAGEEGAARVPPPPPSGVEECAGTAQGEARGAEPEPVTRVRPLVTEPKGV
ncbi:MAG: DUF3306 domain-containing protein [Geminicoccaceae bacterium]|nr:DUF3306 domain-containing protein [Geminicoccaceae bacterium]